MKRFARLSRGIADIDIVGQFTNAEVALRYAGTNRVELAFIDIAPPEAEALALARELRRIRKDILIVFTAEHGEYVRDANLIGGDYYLIKPYTKATLGIAMERMRLLAHRLRKNLYIQTNGGFMVFKDGQPIPLTGKAKEVLTLIVSRRGKEITNKEIYSAVWKGREYSNDHMCVLYNTLGRLRTLLRSQGCENLIISTMRGHLINTEVFDCDQPESPPGAGLRQ